MKRANQNHCSQWAAEPSRMAAARSDVGGTRISDEQQAGAELRAPKSPFDNFAPKSQPDNVSGCA